ncbi:MAG: DUF2946 family protein [Nevskia sp.]|nr:DUF2946 family protein [Nevskia sp.]
MEDWVIRAMARWPDVPALFGWLGLDRRGRWLIRGEPITRPQIVETINRNYAADEYGRWYFQNGPQRGYMRLEYAPLVLHTAGDGLLAHTGACVGQVLNVFLDEEGSVLLLTDLGPGLLADVDLDWALSRLEGEGGQVPNEAALSQALALPSGAPTGLRLRLGALRLPVFRLDGALAPEVLGFVRNPQA